MNKTEISNHFSKTKHPNQSQSILKSFSNDRLTDEQKNQPEYTTFQNSVIHEMLKHGMNAINDFSIVRKSLLLDKSILTGNYEGPTRIGKLFSAFKSNEISKIPKVEEVLNECNHMWSAENLAPDENKKHSENAEAFIDLILKLSFIENNTTNTDDKKKLILFISKILYEEDIFLKYGKMWNLLDACSYKPQLNIAIFNLIFSIQRLIPEENLLTFQTHLIHISFLIIFKNEITHYGLISSLNNLNNRINRLHINKHLIEYIFNIIESSVISKITLYSLEFVFQTIKNISPWLFSGISHNKNIMLKLVNRSGILLQFACEELRNDKELVLPAINQNCFSLQFASPELQDDHRIVLTAIQHFGTSLRFASENLRNNDEIVSAAVKQCGVAIQFASNRLQRDREIVLAAVHQNGLALQYLEPDLLDDKQIISYAVQNNAFALSYANPRLKNDEEILRFALLQNGMALMHASTRLKNSKELALLAVNNNIAALKYLGENLQCDKQIAITAIQKNPYAYAFLNSFLKNDLEISAMVSDAIKQQLM